MSADRDTIVKTYGRDSLLVAWNPILSGVMSAAGLRVGLFSDGQVRERMEKDALEMLGRGFRVSDSQEFSVPLLFPPGRTTNYYRVTYRRS